MMFERLLKNRAAAVVAAVCDRRTVVAVCDRRTSVARLSATLTERRYSIFQRLLPALCLLFFCSAVTARAGEKVWAALVFATQSDDPAEIPDELEPYAKRLQGVFGYNQFKIVGQGTKELKSAEEQWIIPSSRFYARIIAHDRKGPGCVLDLQLYNTKKLLVETHAELGPGSPLFIRGAQCAKGQLIIVLVIR